MKAAIAFVVAGLTIGAAGQAPAPVRAPWRASGLASFDEVWQTVADTFYDPTFGGIDWPAARRELRPRAEAAASPAGIRQVIVELLARLDRSHFELLSEDAAVDEGPAGDAVVPIDVRIARAGVVVVGVAPASPAAQAGLAPGQIVLAVDGLSTADWRVTGTTSAERRQALTRWRRVDRALHGPARSTVSLRVRVPDGTMRTVIAPRVREPGEVVTFGNLPPLPVRTDVRELRSAAGRRVGFIGFNLWMTAIDGPVAAAIDRFRHADGLVLDLRGNPGGLAAMMSGIAGHLIADSAVRLGRMRTRQATLEFRVNPRAATPDGRRVEPYAGPVALLVDELTGSTSECFAGALQDLGRVRVFGRPTMGQALPALTRRLSNGDVLMYAVGDFVTAAGRSLEAAGVTPDVVVPVSIESLAEGRDPVVEAALRWLDSPLALGGRLLLSSDDLQAR